VLQKTNCGTQRSQLENFIAKGLVADACFEAFCNGVIALVTPVWQWVQVQGY
jgi:hypothetical protein